jgi:hypothetical protein
VTARKARQARNRLLANRIIVAALVLAVLAALYGLVRLTRPVVLSSAPRVASPGRLTVTSALVGCPAPGSAGITGGAIAIANVPAAPGTGQMALTRLDPASAGTAVATAPRPGQLTIETVKAAPAVPKRLAGTVRMANGLAPTSPARGGLIVTATGANAQGLDVEQLGPGGQPTARCQPAGSDFWFVGPGSPALHIYLYLMNTDSQPADAAVSIQTESGPLLGPQDSGIVVPPHSMIVQTLDKLTRGAKAIAMHVTTSTGRVVAAVRETTSRAKEGTWLPAAGEPATAQVLAGLPANPGQREVYITVPGNGAAQVKVTAISSRGSYQPTGGSVPLLSHQTTGVSIPSLSGISGAIKITSTVPITAALEISGGPRGAPGAFIVGSDAIVGQGVVAANTAGPIGTSELVLSAPYGAASVSVSQAGPGEALTGLNGQVVHIPAKSAVQLKLTVPKRSKVSLVAIVVTPLPGSGPVYAGRIAVIRDSVQTVQSVVSSPARVELSPVRESLLAILGSLHLQGVSYWSSSG